MHSVREKKLAICFWSQSLSHDLKKEKERNESYSISAYKVRMAGTRSVARCGEKNSDLQWRGRGVSGIITGSRSLNHYLKGGKKTLAQKESAAAVLFMTNTGQTSNGGRSGDTSRSPPLATGRKVGGGGGGVGSMDAWQHFFFFD